jgi:hypothetical protein
MLMVGSTVLFGMSKSARAYDECSWSDPVLPCTIGVNSYDSFIGTHPTGASNQVFYNAGSVTFDDLGYAYDVLNPSGSLANGILLNNNVLYGGTGSFTASTVYKYNVDTWPNFYWIGADPAITVSFVTRIISFNPQDGEVVDIGGMATGTVDFDIHVYINDDDIGDFLSIKIIFRNIDQNTLASGECTPLDFSIFCSNYSFDIFRGIATTSGDFYYSSSTVLKAGNYRVEASINTATNFLGINLGFFTFLGGISDVQNHQFVVGSSTWIGNMSQTIFSGIDEFFGTLPGNMSATSSAKMCMPFRNNVATAFLNIGNSTSTDDFSPMGCLGFLFVPDSNQMKNTLEQFRVGVLQRAPWGYVSRLVYILNSSATTSLPVISYTFPDGGGLDGATWNIDAGEMIAGAGTLLNSVEDRNGNNIRDVLEPLVKLVISIALIFGIVTDLTGSHGKSVHTDNKKT